MERLNKAFRRRIRRELGQSPYKKGLDRFIPRRNEYNLERRHQQLVWNCGNSREGDCTSDVTRDWPAHSAFTLVGNGEEDLKILEFSPHQDNKSGL